MEKSVITPEQDLANYQTRLQLLQNTPEFKKAFEQVAALSQDAKTFEAKANELGLAKEYAQFQQYKTSQEADVNFFKSIAAKAIKRAETLSIISSALTAIGGVAGYLSVRKKADWGIVKKSLATTASALGTGIVSLLGGSIIMHKTSPTLGAPESLGAIQEGIERIDNAAVTLITQIAARMVEQKPAEHAAPETPEADGGMAAKYATGPAESKVAAMEQSKAAGAASGIA